MDKSTLSDDVVEYILTLDLQEFADINVNAVADKFKVNRIYLSRKFRDDKNIALPDYIIKVKMHRATALMSADEDLSTEDVAQALGYSNPQYFSRLFKARIGTTPGKYKRYIKKVKSAKNGKNKSKEKKDKTELKDKIRQFIESNLVAFEDEEEFADSDNFFEMGFVNSLFAMKLVNYIENELGIEVGVDDLDIGNFSSIERIMAFIKSKKKK
ncbi:MAG: helix-turn-helix domain-containing protein [Candidatus Aminicenantes bacterium]|nr:helix-turn-helix domain-containing protein [Candidatus Aminicenantes bacterium]